MKAKYLDRKGFLCKSSTRTYALTIFPISTCITGDRFRGLGMINSTSIATYNLLRKVTNLKTTDLEIRDRLPRLTSRLLANQQMKINGITAEYKEPWRYLDI